MSAMNGGFFHLVELVFTAYAVPALLVPFVWIVRRMRRPPASRLPETSARLRRALTLYGALSAVWLGVWFALAVGLPIERGGRPAGALLWLAYGLLNLALAALLVRFTAGYGGLPEGKVKDRLFLYLVSAVVAQPIATACAFAVLYRVLGVVYHLTVPSLPAVQEGI
jgi:hypothetical protein